MAANTGSAIATKPTANITTRANHCVVRTPSKPNWRYHCQSAYRLANAKNAMTSTMRTPMVMAIARRTGFGGEGVAGPAVGVEVTLSS